MQYGRVTPRCETTARPLICGTPRGDGRGTNSLDGHIGAVPISRPPDHARNLQPLFLRQPDKLESRANAEPAANDSDGGHQLLTQLQINGDRVADMTVPLNDGSQPPFAQIRE